jgi:predicted ribosomally synthesized peptide with nif11-like leader
VELVLNRTSEKYGKGVPAMSKEAAIQFFKAVDKSPELQRQIPMGQSDSPDNIKKVIDVAAKAGYAITLEDMRAVARSRAEEQVRSGELSEAELETVAGGLRCTLTCICTGCCNTN